MATNALKGIMNFFKGRETKTEEAKEKKLSPAAYAKGEKSEGEKVKSTPAKKPTGSAAAKKPTVAKATTRAKKK